MTAAYRVVLLNGNDEPQVWLTERLRVTNAAWEAAAFPKSEADAFAAWANRTIVNGLDECRWVVEPVTPLEHYADMADGAKAERERMQRELAQAITDVGEEFWHRNDGAGLATS